ncbi:MAG: NBR1-Ig-like domain-containing protein, partial [Armatimonadota bacterium]|nr:NBR1-Ig-like domain-containing protein [Armatimonadota bacterium]
MRLRLALVSLSAAAALFVTSGARAQNVRWDADGTKTLTTDGWTIAGVQGDGLTKSADFSTGQADAGTNGVWSINDSDSTRYMRMYRDPVGISSTQGLVMSRVEFVSGGNTNGTFGYSSASGNHSVVVGVRDGAVNIKDAQGNTTTYNGGTSVTVPGGTLSYRIYALRWYYDATPAFRYDLWVSDGSDWSANPSDWTQLVSAGAFSSQSALIDHNGVSRTGLLLGSFGNTTTLWQGKIDYIIWSGRSAEQRPWHFAPTSGGLVDNATPTGDTIPATMFPGLTYSVSVTMQNTGNSYWQSVGEYKLGAVGSDPFAGGRQNMSAGPTVAPGSAYTFEFNMTAPQTEGTYTTDWQMVRELVSWFGGIDAKQVQVTWGASPPAAPIVVSPARGEVLGANRPDLVWEGDPHDAYQVRINTVDNPDSSIVWDSGQVWYSGTVTSTGTAMSGSLTPSTNHYVFVRVHNARGWGAWSAYNQRVFVSGELINDPYLVSGGGLQWWDYVCYNPDRNEYCITWQNGYVIHWRRLDSTGANIGSEMVLSDNSSGHHFSVVCYN